MNRLARVPGVAAVALAGLVLLVLGTTASFAQDDGDRVREQLEMTNEGLERAARVVRESDSDRGRELLEQAVRVQQGAWASFHAGRLPMALRLTREARDIGRRALQLAHEDTGLRGRVERELEKAQRALRHVVEELGDSLDDQGRRLLHEAESLIQRGGQQFGERNYEVALRLAISAQRLIRQAASGGDGPSGGDGRLLRELERTDHLIERASPAVRESGHEGALQFLERAIHLQEEAWVDYRNGQQRAAYTKTREVRGLIQRALALVRGPVDTDRIAKAIEETDALLERATEVVKSSGNEHAIGLLEKAREHQGRAKSLFEEGKHRNALGETRVARRLALRAVRMAEEGGTR